MHKSGTTLVSQMLHHSGINMGEFDPSITYDKGNQYEREDALQLDLAILGAKDDRVLDLAAPGQLSMTTDQRSRMQRIIADCQSDHADWGFKDPRASLLYPLWAEELPEHKIIVVYRHASQVWGHFIWAGKRYYHTNFNRAYSYLRRWQEHNRSILGYLASTRMDHVVLEYGQLMSSAHEFNRLQQFVGGGLTDLRNPKLFRNRSDMDVFLQGADWLLKKKYGYSVDDTMKCLEAYR
jgi:hypothetical protein